DEVLDLVRLDVQALAGLGPTHLVHDDRALEARVIGELADRLLERADDDRGTGTLVRLLDLVELDRLDSVQERDAAARHDALLEGGAGGLERVLDAVLLLLHLGLGGSADLDDRDAARQLREALLELLTIEVGVGVLDLGLDLVDATLDRIAVAVAVDDRRRVLRDDHTTGTAQLRELRVLELEAHLLGDHLAARVDRDFLEHAPASFAEAR